mmetsp:Transcript_4527/g.7712  ORF Transcript_4527/g.7712 Transcript_4527/m.7712 type:complete len:100 (+) Transcript_4527:117-416(+)
MYKDEARAMFFGKSGDDSFLDSYKFASKTHHLLKDRAESAKWRHYFRAQKNGLPVFERYQKGVVEANSREGLRVGQTLSDSTQDMILGFIFGVQYVQRS